MLKLPTQIKYFESSSCRQRHGQRHGQHHGHLSQSKAYQMIRTLTVRIALARLPLRGLSYKLSGVDSNCQVFRVTRLNQIKTFTGEVLKAA